MTVNELAAQLEVAPTTVSLMVAELSRRHVVDRTEDNQDRRRKVVSITELRQGTIEKWLSGGAFAWREALEVGTVGSDCRRGHGRETAFTRRPHQEPAGRSSDPRMNYARHLAW
jgi:DNA-binding MarR family transcriptional regulator